MDDVNFRISFLLSNEDVVVLMKAQQEQRRLDVGIAQGERDPEEGLRPQAGQMDESSDMPNQTLSGRFVFSDPAARLLRFETEGEGEITLPIQFDEDEPVLQFTLKRARIDGEHRGARGSRPEEMQGRLIGAFSVQEVLDGAIYPLIDNFPEWDENQRKTFRDLARGLITNGADIDVGTDDPKISGVFQFTATGIPW